MLRALFMMLKPEHYSNLEPMENNQNNDPARTEEGKPVTEGTDQALKQADNADDTIGDVHPTERSETFQEEMNAEQENQSDSSKISGENL
jgi:hypothetical protein